MEIKTNEIKTIQLVDKLPEISIRTNGFALQTIKKGYFKTANGEKIKLLINTDKQPIIYITTTDNQNIYYSSKNESNLIILNELKQILP